MFFNKREREIIHLSSKVAELEAINLFLTEAINDARAKLVELERDNRELRNNLLVRMGLLPDSNRIEKRQGEDLKPIRKATVPWSVAAAKLEADSKERYWKKVIEDRENSVFRPSSSVDPSSSSQSENPDEAKDLEELSK
jgi:hypothetical protein